MRSLTFAPARLSRIREARFERRSYLPASAACIVAGSVRETLASLFGAPVVLALSEPSIPSAHAWETILKDAILHRVRGTVAEAGIVLRPADAAAVAAAAFSEPQRSAGPAHALSPIERAIVERITRAIASSLGAICGTYESGAFEVALSGGFTTYFELLVETPVEARIGIALSRDPSPEPHGRLDVAHIARVELRAFASFRLELLQAAEVARLAPGAILPVRSAYLHRGMLATCGRTLARGVCGVREGRYAFAVDAVKATA